MKAPLIIIGMHRSGTSLITKVLEKAGIFMGVIKDHNYEAMHFLSLNQQTMWADGSDWFDPKVPDEINWKTYPAEVLWMEHFRISGRWAKFRLQLQNPDWGWKDPRNTFTLPMWLSLYPNAKVLHVVREQEAVARSLKKRNSIAGEVHNGLLEDMEFNYRLADKYVNQARSYREELGNRYHEVRYDEITRLDRVAITALEKFTGKSLRELFKKYVKKGESA